MLYLCCVYKKERFGGGALIGSLVTKRFFYIASTLFHNERKITDNSK